MTTQEIREYRTTCKKLVEIEERSKLLEELRKKNVCLREEELFIQGLKNKFKVLGNKATAGENCHTELVKTALKFKIKDNVLHGVKVRKKRNLLRGKIEAGLGSRSSMCRRVVQEVKEYSAAYRLKLKKKHAKKVAHLVGKYGIKKKINLDKETLRLMGDPKIFYNDDITVDEVRKPVVVEMEGENITLSSDEEEVLKLGPKYCIFTDLTMENFETDLEECILKIKWDLMASDKEKAPGLEDLALEVLLGKDTCMEIDAEREEEMEVQEAMTRNPFNPGDKSFNLAKRRVTDLKGNSRVHFPRKPRSLEEESALETMRMELKSLFSNYVTNNCKGGHKQVSNLSQSQLKGLKSLRKRVGDGELVIVPTDKSGNLAVMSQSTYLAAGLKHTKNDIEVGWEVIKESQKELNGHVSMLIKFFKIGSYWEHGPRIRETMMGEGLSTCPLSLLFKDHKGWSPKSGSVPPTRPVVGGHLGINLFISELVSDILDPVVTTYVGGREIISTEDMVARVEILNTKNEGWSPTSYWGGTTTEEFRACETCTGDSEYKWEDGNPEICECEDGIDKDGRSMVTQRCMEQVRRWEWEEVNGWNTEEVDRKVSGNEVNHEDLQDVTVPMIIVGTDVVNLYPSLDIGKVVGQVREAVQNSNIKWEETDYLEGARYVALNWSEEKCRSSGLWRILPKRRHKNGTRPGLKGVGPQGGVRGDQDQWVFPHVRLRPKEKRLLVAVVVEIATEAMFQHHYYHFGGKKYKQTGGGPIGLRGTCTIARLVMQIWDRKWEGLVGTAGLKLELYIRYMDDGRIMLHPIKRGWRWVNGGLLYCIKWEQEDWNRTLLEVTVDVLRDSMRGVADFLQFTYETEADFDGWLPTLDTNLRVGEQNIISYKYYEKPTTTNTTIRFSTAMAENPKMRSLANDVVRRLLNTREQLPPEYRAEIIDGYGG